MTIIVQTGLRKYTLWNVTEFTVKESQVLPDHPDFVAKHLDRPETRISGPVTIRRV